MRLIVEVEGTLEEMGNQLCDLACSLNGRPMPMPVMLPEPCEENPPEPCEEEKAPAKKGRPKKEVVEEVIVEEEVVDLGEEAEEVPCAKISLNDVIEKLKDYATKYSREKAAKILSKFKVKSVRDLKEDQYPLVLKELE